jgi:hypothetical protein
MGLARSLVVVWGCVGFSLGCGEAPSASASQSAPSPMNQAGQSAAPHGAHSGGVSAMAGATGGGGASASGGAAVASGGIAGTGGGTSALLPVFVAQGHHGRISVSCDDGRSFTFHRSEAEDYRYFADSEHDCDHSPHAGRGIAYGSGSFVTTWGWGHPGRLRRSADAIAWMDVVTATPTYAGVAYGNGVFVTGGNPTLRSKDGLNWEEGGSLTFDFNYRGIEFVPSGGGTFVITGESGEQRAISYSRDGSLWSAPTSRPEPCAQALRGIAGSDSVILIASGEGDICRSLDAGDTWLYQDVTEQFTSRPIWTGNEFRVYEGATLWKSSDGQAWTSEGSQPPSVSIGALSRSPEGTWLAVNAGWQTWYEKQEFYRSQDGISWELLDASKFTGSHPVSFMSFGYVAASSDCGLEP